MNPRITKPQPLASILPLFLPDGPKYVVVAKRPTWACGTCGGSGRRSFYTGFEWTHGWCRVCDSSLGDRGGLVDVWSATEPPTDIFYGDYGLWANHDPDLLYFLGKGDGEFIPLPLGEKVGELRITDAYPIVAADAQWPQRSVICVQRDGSLSILRGGQGSAGFAWASLPNLDGDDISAELVWQADAFVPGRWALAVEVAS